MPTVSRPLNETQTVVLDGSGNGQIKMRPDGSKEYWYPDNVSVIAPNPAGGVPNDEAQCVMYAGPKAAQQYFVDGSASGSTGDSSGRFSGYVIGRTADPYIIAVWTGGDPGAVAVLRVQGTKEVR
jgi:hypothetical protein